MGDRATKVQRIDTASGLPETVAGFKKSKDYILESLLTSYDLVESEAKPCGLFRGQDLVFHRSDVKVLHSKQTWDGRMSRSIKTGEIPARVISRTVGGVARTLELYSFEQTEPLRNLVASIEHGIPANEYGNIDAKRIPGNAKLVPCDNIALCMRVCKSIPGLVWCRCQSGWKRRTPVYIGVVVLVEDYDRVHAKIEEELAEISRSDHAARELAVLAIWRVLFRRMLAEHYIHSVLDS